MIALKKKMLPVVPYVKFGLTVPEWTDRYLLTYSCLTARRVYHAQFFSLCLLLNCSILAANDFVVAQVPHRSLQV